VLGRLRQYREHAIDPEHLASGVAGILAACGASESLTDGFAAFLPAKVLPLFRRTLLEGGTSVAANGGPESRQAALE